MHLLRSHPLSASMPAARWCRRTAIGWEPCALLKCCYDSNGGLHLSMHVFCCAGCILDALLHILLLDWFVLMHVVSLCHK